jgi:hypothetical protein
VKPLTPGRQGGRVRSIQEHVVPHCHVIVVRVVKFLSVHGQPDKHAPGTGRHPHPAAGSAELATVELATVPVGGPLITSGVLSAESHVGGEAVSVEVVVHFGHR